MSRRTSDDWRVRMIARWPYSGMNIEDARNKIHTDLVARGFTDADIQWLLNQGWDPVPYLSGG